MDLYSLKISPFSETQKESGGKDGRDENMKA